MAKVTYRATQPQSKSQATDALIAELRGWRENLGYYLDGEGAGQRAWEHLLIESHKAWTPYIADA